MCLWTNNIHVRLDSLLKWREGSSGSNTLQQQSLWIIAQNWNTSILWQQWHLRKLFMQRNVLNVFSSAFFVEHCHCNNGCFADNAFFDDVTKKGQTISFFAVCAHFQNRKAEKASHYMQDVPRIMLLHAKARWPTAVHLSLWPYTTRMPVHIMNHLTD